MRRIVLLALAAIGLGLVLPPVAAEAKGCIKGAIAGGIAGHYAGNHGFLGAVSGCISGRHTAKRRAGAHPTKSVPSHPNRNSRTVSSPPIISAAIPLFTPGLQARQGRMI